VVQLTLVQTVHYMFTHKSKSLKHLQCLFIDSVSVEVLCYSTVIHVRQSCSVRSLVEKQVLDVYDVDVPDLLKNSLSWLGSSNLIDCTDTSLCDFSLFILVSRPSLYLTSHHRERIKVAFLSLETKTHVEIMDIILIVLCLSLYWKSVRTDNIS
jgi:hypothetical protein